MDKIPTYDFFFPHLPDLVGKSVLEFGCGPGNLLGSDNGLIDRSLYLGVDVHVPSLDLAREANPGAEFLHFNRQNTVYNPKGKRDVLPDVGDRKFDLILSYSVFSHTSIEDMGSCVAWMYDHLADGGRIIVSYANIGYQPCVDYFRQRRVEHNGGCQDIDTTGDFAYLVGNSVRQKAPTTSVKHFVSFFSTSFLKSRLAEYSPQEALPPFGWPQHALIIQR